MLEVPQRVVDRVLTRVMPEGDCLVSTYSVGSHGYAQVGWHTAGARAMTLCHRVAWIAAHGRPIPDDLVVDHLCHNRRCIKPEHLRLLPRAVNASIQKRPVITHCIHGHPFDEVNTYITAVGGRSCRACQRRIYHERKP